MESTNKLDSSTEEVAMVKTDDPMESANNRNILDDDIGEAETVKTDCSPIERLNLPNERESIIVSENMGNIGHGNLPVKMEIPEKIQNDTSDNMEITNSVIKYIGSEIPGSLPASSVDENNPVCPIKTDESDKHVPINISEAAMMVKREIISNMEGFPMSRQNLLNEEEINTTSQTIEGSGHGTLPNMPMETSEIVRNYISGSNMEVKNPGLKITGPEMLENMSNISIDNRLIKTEVTNNYVPGTVGLPRSDYLVNLFGGTSARPIFYAQNLAVPSNRTVRFGFPHVCGICNKAFREKGLLSKHIRIHTGEKPFPCEICDKRFRIRADLKIHMVVHNSERLFACEICKKTFKRKVHLRGHMLVHSSEKLYSCEKCCLSFARKHSMKRHMSRCKGKEAISIAEYKQNQSFVDVRMNQNNKDEAQPTLAPIDLSKPYVCGTCGFNFETKASLSFHMKIHSEDKPFFCEICNMSFTRKANLKRHQIVHTDERRYPCYICGQTFKLQSHINDHMLSHGQSKPFTCKFCGASYTKKVSFQNHLANCNNNAPKGHSSTLDHNVRNEQEVNSTSPSGLDILSHLASYRRLQNEQSIGSSFPSGLDIFNQLSSHRKLRNQRGFENNIPSGLDLFNQLTSHRTVQNEQDIESNIPSGLDIFNRLTSYRQVQNEQGVESNIPSGLDIFNHLTSLRKVQNEHKDDESIVPDEADSLDDETSHCKVPNEQKDTENSIPCESNSLDHTTSQCEVRNEPEVGQESIPCRSDVLDHHRKLEMLVNNDTEEPIESESRSNEIKLSRNCSKLLSAVSKLNNRRKFIINSSDEDKTAETDNSLIYAKSQIDDPNSIAQSISDVYLTKQVLMKNLFLE